jgi:hypothetical protein
MTENEKQFNTLSSPGGHQNLPLRRVWFQRHGTVWKGVTAAPPPSLTIQVAPA